MYKNGFWADVTTRLSNLLGCKCIRLQRNNSFFSAAEDISDFFHGEHFPVTSDKGKLQIQGERA